MFTRVSTHPRDKTFLFQRPQLCLFWCKHTTPLHYLRSASSPSPASCCRTGSPSPTRARSHQPTALYICIKKLPALPPRRGRGWPAHPPTPSSPGILPQGGGQDGASAARSGQSVPRAGGRGLCFTLFTCTGSFRHLCHP